MVYAYLNITAIYIRIFSQCSFECAYNSGCISITLGKILIFSLTGGLRRYHKIADLHLSKLNCETFINQPQNLQTRLNIRSFTVYLGRLS